MSKSILHVVPHDQAWAVKREGNERASSTHPTQKEAIESARELAKELDDIVIHRPDGTIRERVTYFGANGLPHPAQEGGEPRTAVPTDEPRTTARPARPAKVGPEDLVGVASRVSWEAVLGGAVAAIAAYITLSLLALALGLTISDRTWGRNFTVAGAVISGIILVLSLFLGGYVASCATAGEQPREAGFYGVLVWGVVFLLLVTGGLGFGFGHLSGVRELAPTADTAARAERVKQELGLNDQQAQRYEALAREARGPAANVRPRDAAWWAFGGVALSLLASIVGSWLGGGPEVSLRRVATDRPHVAAPQPA